MHIRKLASGAYQATVYVGKDADGKYIKKYVTRPTKKECKVAATEMEMDFQESGASNIKIVRLSTWIDEWLELNKSRLSPSTIHVYKRYAKVHYKPYFGDMLVQDIKEIHIKRFMAEKLETLTECTVRKLIFVLGRILREVLKGKCPVNDIVLPPREKYKPHVITEQDFNKIKNAFNESPYLLAVLLAAYCGLRRGEIYALKWDDVDTKNNTIRVDEARTLTDDGYITQGTKSHNGNRVVAAPKAVMELIEDRRMNQKEISNYIYTGRPDNLTHRFKEIQELHGLTPVRFHDLRHYHATWLYKNGIPDLYAAQRLGHDIQTLKRIYQHIDKSVQRDIDKNIINLIENPGT